MIKHVRLLFKLIDKRTILYEVHVIGHKYSILIRKYDLWPLVNLEIQLNLSL